MSLVRNFFEGQESLSHINKTFIRLLPKIPNASSITQYWLISRINTIYKVISKLITICIPTIALDLISSNQRAFCKGKNCS